MNQRIRSALQLVGCILLCQAAGLIGAVGMRGESTWVWHENLSKPPINPPGWIFGPVWTLLYTLMGIALWMVLRQGKEHPLFQRAVLLFLAQLVLNALWTPLFFWWQQIGGALFDLTLLLALLIFTILSFRKIRPAAAWLLIPYSFWAGFALVLNAWILLLNYCNI